MSLTEQQRAYHLRKIRNRVAKLDVNKDGTITREGYASVSQRMAELFSLTAEQAKSVREGYLKIADILELKEGVKVSIKEFAPKMSNILLSKSPAEKRAMIEYAHAPVFNIIDTSKDGRISLEEFKVYLKAMNPNLTDKDVETAFNAIDTNKNGKISREEFYVAAQDFLFGVEETELSRVFWGKLFD